MDIYIDESGGFAIPSIPQSKVSCSAALIIPTSKRAEIFEGFLKLRSSWGLGNEEIKGNKLNESQIASVINFLSKYEVFLDICGVDTGLHDQKQIEDFKNVQANKITENLTDKHHPDLIKEVNELREKMLALSNPLFVQFYPVILLIEQVIKTAVWYYGQRNGEELGSFNWLVDAKDKKITNFEDLWSTLMLPILAQNQEIVLIEEGDYSYFDKKFKISIDDAPIYVRKEQPKRTKDLIDFKAIMKDSFKFGDSKDEIGLQLIDILAGAFTRALNGKLKKEGWENLGSLIVDRGFQTIRMLSLEIKSEADKEHELISSQHINILNAICKKAKPMFVQENKRKEPKEFQPPKISSFALAKSTFVQQQPKIGRNERCPCNSGKKFKKCCGFA